MGVGAMTMEPKLGPEVDRIVESGRGLFFWYGLVKEKISNTFGVLRFRCKKGELIGIVIDLLIRGVESLEQYYCEGF